MSNKLKWLLRDFVYNLREDYEEALKEEGESSAEDTEFHAGRKVAFWSTLQSLSNLMDAFDFDPAELGLGDIVPEFKAAKKSENPRKTSLSAISLQSPVKQS